MTRQVLAMVLSVGTNLSCTEQLYELENTLFLCPQTGTTCMLKTGVKDGPSKGKSFYICVDKHGCDFSQPARYLAYT